MAEDDEIDILGDFNLDNYLAKNDSSINLVSQNSDFLNCDYTIHPQWLLDKPSANPDCWYNSTIETSEVDSGQISTENAITDESGWTEKEKNLLDRGIEIFGKSNLRLSQFIGSKTPSEVRYYLKYFHSDVQQQNYGSFSGNVDLNDILDDTQIPASIEEVIAVSTTKPEKSKRNRKAKFKIKTNLKVPFKQKVSNFNSKIEITTGKGLSVPISEGEEIVKLQKNSDSDTEIDVDIEDSEEEPLKPPQNTIKETYLDLTNVKEEIVNELTTLNVPKQEKLLNDGEISELEKLIHFEFFEGRPAKTPKRYLKIRNYIINYWLNQKPNYVTKTSIRRGLKNCGDVNSISRIHCFLEQNGIINYGCEQVNYVRPLYNLFRSLMVGKEKICESVRNRSKRKFSNDGVGGYTLTHDEKGAVINTTIVNEDPKQKTTAKKQLIRLIYCRPVSAIKFKVKLELSALLLMDLHAHTSLSEVMGLLGGKWQHSTQTLHINCYVSCRNIASSATHCDMCPISQAKASDLIHDKNLKILGWFHSHPTFAPEPSQQDLDTQQDVQLFIGSGVPCLGMILSPFSANGALIASPFRCMIVEKLNEKLVPYKFNVELNVDSFDLGELERDVKMVLKDCKINWQKPYFLDHSITHLDKFITSVRMHLAKCGSLNKMMCDKIIEIIEKICRN